MTGTLIHTFHNPQILWTEKPKPVRKDVFVFIYEGCAYVLNAWKHFVNRGGTNSSGLSTWGLIRPHMWTQLLFAWHIGVIRWLVFAPIEKKHCTMSYWAGRLSKWQLGVFFPLALPQCLCFYCLCLLKAVGVTRDLFNSGISQALWSQAMSDCIRYSFSKLALNPPQTKKKPQIQLYLQRLCLFLPKPPG